MELVETWARGSCTKQSIKVHCFHLRQEKWSNSVTKDESGLYREGSKAR